MSKILKGGGAGGRLNQSNVRKMRRGGRGRERRLPKQPRGQRQLPQNTPPQGEGACWFTSVGYIDQCSGWNNECQQINEWINSQPGSYTLLPTDIPESWINKCIYMPNYDINGQYDITGRQSCIGLDEEWMGGWCPCADSPGPEWPDMTGGYCIP